MRASDLWQQGELRAERPANRHVVCIDSLQWSRQWYRVLQVQAECSGSHQLGRHCTQRTLNRH